MLSSNWKGWKERTCEDGDERASKRRRTSRMSNAEPIGALDTQLFECGDDMEDDLGDSRKDMAPTEGMQMGTRSTDEDAGDNITVTPKAIMTSLVTPSRRSGVRE